MKLSRVLAQKIVEEMMKVLPYNINVMNEKGIIIGSGDKRRIGKVHEGAIECIKKRGKIEVYKLGKGAKQGVNEPIFMDGEPIGVVGITGNPQEVRPFSELVRITTILLIEQAAMLKESQEKEKQMEEFLYELIYRKKEYDKEFYSRAANYGVNLDNKYQGIILMGEGMGEFEENFKKMLPQNTYYLRLDSYRIVIFLEESNKGNLAIEELKNRDEIKKIGIGNFSEIVSFSIENAITAIDIGKKITPNKKVYTYDEFEFFIGLNHDNKNKYVDLIKVLKKSGDKLEVVKTLQTYIEENGEMNEVARKLNIHRNTLNYRLEKINEKTGKNPKKYFDLLELIAGLIW